MTTTRLGRPIGVLVAMVIRAPWLTVLAIVGAAGASLYLSLDHLGINTNTADMISPELEWRRDFIAYRDGFPARDGNIVAVIDGASAEARSRYARALAAALRAEPDLFPSVFLEGEGEFFERNGLLYLPIAELEALADRLIEAQPLLGRLARDVSGAGVLDVLGDSLANRDELSDAIRDDLDGILEEMAATLNAASGGSRRPVLWGGLIGLPADDSARTLMLVRPSVDYARVRPARAAIERLHEIGASLDPALSQGIRLRLTGNLAMEHEELSSITQSAGVAGIASLLMVIAVLLFTLRSLRLLLVALVTLLTGLGLTAAFAALTVGHLNLLSVAFAVLYIGLGVDFILHLTLRLKELQRAGVGLDRALVATAQGVGGSLVICAVTTAVGFFVFIPTDFDGISELGLISGGGMLISLLVSLSLLPALIKLFWRDRHTVAVGRRSFRFAWPELPPRPTCIAAAVIVVLAALLLPELRFDGNPIHLRDPDSESIQALNDLAADRDAPLFDLAVLVPNTDAATSMAAALGELDTVSQVRTTASLVPARQDEKLFVIEDLSFVLGSTLRGFAPVPGAPNRVVAALTRLQAQLAEQSDNSLAEAALRTAADNWLARIATLPATEADAAAAAVDAAILGNLVEQMRRLEQGLRARPFTLDDLPVEIRERFVNAAGQQLVEVTPSDDLNDSEAAARFVAEVRSIAPHATGLPVVYEEASATVTRAFMLALAYALIAVTLLLLVFMRSLRDTLLVLVPIIFAAVVTAGLSVALGLPLNFANIIALPLLVGVGVDSGIHMVHRQRTERPADGDLLHTSTSRAVFASALTTVASFGNLAFSSHRGMASMGQLLTLGMAVSLIAVLVVLPALMRWSRKSA